MCHFLYNSLSTVLKCDTWLLGAISFTIAYQNHWNMTYGCFGPFPLQLPIKIIEMWPVKAMSHFSYNSLSQSLKYELWQLWGISFTIPYQNHWNTTCDCWGHFLYNSLSKSSKYDLWLLWAISFTIPHQNHWNMTYEC